VKRPKSSQYEPIDKDKTFLDDYTHQQAAASLGVSLSALRRWVRAERGGGDGPVGQKTALNLADQQELARLRKENERLRMEREILKKAAAFFAKELG
jgi:transposase